MVALNSFLVRGVLKIQPAIIGQILGGDSQALATATAAAGIEHCWLRFDWAKIATRFHPALSLANVGCWCFGNGLPQNDKHDYSHEFDFCTNGLHRNGCGHCADADTTQSR